MNRIGGGGYIYRLATRTGDGRKTNRLFLRGIVQPGRLTVRADGSIR